MEQEKPKRFRKWCARNADMLWSGGVIAGTFAVTAGLVAWAIKVENDHVKELEQQEKDWYDGIQAALTQGQQIIPNRDGSYWVVEKTPEKV